MRTPALITSSLLLALAVAQDSGTSQSVIKPADPVLDNPVGIKYEAKFESKDVTGSLTFTAGTDGKGVDITVKLEGFVGQQGPFGYHIHDQPVPEDGSCSATLAHLDPYGRGQATPCDSTTPEKCEVGDLSGKHGKIPKGDGETVTYNTAYNDLYASTKKGIGAFLGNRSIVIHRSDASRLVCTNIKLVTDTDDSYDDDSDDDGSYENTENGSSEQDADSGTNMPKTSGTTTGGPNADNTTAPTTLSEPVPFTGAAASYGVSAALAMVGVVAGLMAAL